MNYWTEAEVLQGCKVCWIGHNMADTGTKGKVSAWCSALDTESCSGTDDFNVQDCDFME